MHIAIRIWVVWAVVAASAANLSGYTDVSTPSAQLQRIKEKADRAKTGIMQRAQVGSDPAPMVTLMKQAGAKIKQGTLDEAEALIDQVLRMLEKGDRVVQQTPSQAASPSDSGLQQLLVQGAIRNSQGIFDPSVEYDQAGDVGWLAYSAVDRASNALSVSTHLAKSTDHGKTWTYIQSLFDAYDDEVTLKTGEIEKGIWRYEVSTLVHDPEDSGKEWKVFVHRYFFSPRLKRSLDYTWIAYRYASDPEGNWSDEVALFHAGKNPPAPYDNVRVDLNGLDPDLSNVRVYTELGTLSHDNRLYMSLVAWGHGDGTGLGNARIVLIVSENNGEKWTYVGAALDDNRDARTQGFAHWGASSLFKVKNRILLSANGRREGSNRLQREGTYIFEFEDITKATLKRDASGLPLVVKHVKPELEPERIARGESDYDEHNVAGGLLFPILERRQGQVTFTIYNSNEEIF